MKVTLKELFINEFGLDVEAMEVGVPIDVSEACIGVKAFNEETGKDELAKVNFAIKKQLQSNLKIKLKGRLDFEQPVADKHLFAIIKHNDNKIDYTFASDLQVGMKLITDSGEDEIECIEKSEDAYVYDMETSFKNYYTNGILSHNSLMSHLPSQCVVPETIIEVTKGEDDLATDTTIANLFSLLGYADFTKMKENEFVDVADENFYTLSYNTKTNKNEKRLIEQIVYKGEQDIYDVTLTHGEVLLSGSGGHRIYDVNKKDFVYLQDVTEAVVLNSVYEAVPVYIKKTDVKRPVLDIQVEGNENYYTNGILSHNTGGKAIRFYASTRNRITKVDQIKSGTDPIGIKIRVRNYKNKTGQPWRDAEMELYFENGFNSDNEYLEFLVKFDIIHKAGGWFSAPDLGMPKLQGGAKVQEWLKENPTIYDELKKKVDQKLLVKNELDATNVDPIIAGVGDADPETEEEATSPVIDLTPAALDVDAVVEDPPILDI